MLIFCLLLFQFPKIKTETFPPVTATGPPPPTNAGATTSLQRPSINASVVFKSMTRNKYGEIALSFHQLASIHRIHQQIVYFGILIKYIRKQKTNIKWLCGWDFHLVFNINCIGYILWYYYVRNLGSCICFWNKRGLIHDMVVRTSPFGLILGRIS